MTKAILFVIIYPVLMVLFICYVLVAIVVLNGCTILHKSMPNWVRKDGKSRNDQMPRQIGAETGLKLQPAFVEWMMGFPPGWTDLNSPSPNTARKDSKV